jgi:ribosomal protein S18 acetylase RimI-like enzyme
MTVDIVPYGDSRIEDVVSIFNREHRGHPLVAPLTPDVFRARIAAKDYFEPDNGFVLYRDGAPLGFALTCNRYDESEMGYDTRVGAVDGLFFPASELQLGEALLEHCIAHLTRAGALKIWGFASYGGYPFWRDIYCGAEPVCLTAYSHAWVAFMGQGFVHHQQSVNYVGAPRDLGYRSDLDYRIADLALDTRWLRNSWLGLRPQVIDAYLGGAFAGRLGFVDLPLLSAHRGTRLAGIYSMNVEPGLRRQGVASSMIGVLFERMVEGGYDEVLVGTTVENAPARRTYEKAGLEIVAFRSGTNLTLG